MFHFLKYSSCFFVPSLDRSVQISQDCAVSTECSKHILQKQKKFLNLMSFFLPVVIKKSERKNMIEGFFTFIVKKRSGKHFL